MVGIPPIPALTILFGETPVGVIRTAPGTPNGHTFEWTDNYLKIARKTAIRLIPQGFDAAHALPLREGPTSYTTHPDFEYMPGFAWDSMPDRWGNSVMLAAFKRLGYTRTPTALQKLAYVGDRAIGGLRFRPRLETEEASDSATLNLEDARLRVLAERLALGTVAPGDPIELESLPANAGTAGGAHAKCLIGYNPSKGKAMWASNTDILAKHPAMKACILKIGGVSAATLPKLYLENLTRIEHAYGALARRCGLAAAKTHLIEANGNWHLAIERFDREGATRHHLMTYAAATHRLHQENAAGYEDIANAMNGSMTKIAGVEDIFRRAMFNFAAGITDDHIKNHALMLKDNAWSLSPPYDLVWSPKTFHATTIRGANAPGGLAHEQAAHLAQVCKLGATAAADICQTLADEFGAWENEARAAHIAPEQIEQMRPTLDTGRALMGRLAKELRAGAHSA